MVRVTAKQIRQLKDIDEEFDFWGIELITAAKKIGFTCFERYNPQLGKWGLVGSGHDFNGRTKYRLPANFDLNRGY